MLVPLTAASVVAEAWGAAMLRPRRPARKKVVLNFMIAVCGIQKDSNNRCDGYRILKEYR